jgi:hypothetical protein
MKKAVSVTLAEDNVLWLKAQAAASVKSSVSDVLDNLIVDARTNGRGPVAGMRSVVGTVDLPPDDPDLAAADTYVQTLFDSSLRRPMLVRARPPKQSRRTRRG